jgi:hypothetical protein
MSYAAPFAALAAIHFPGATTISATRCGAAEYKYPDDLYALL